jgi:translation initiation factor IF-3
MAHPELGSKILDDVLEAVGPAAKVDTQARLEGRSMSMTLSPDKQAQEAIKKAAIEAERQAKADAEADEAAEEQLPETAAVEEQPEGVPDAEDENVEDGS